MCRGQNELGSKERFYIEQCIRDGMSHNEIARKLNVSRQCVDYEVRKGTVKQMKTDLRVVSVYSADYSERVSRINKRRTGRHCKFNKSDKLITMLDEEIRKDYSPYSSLVNLKCEDLISVSTVYNYVRKGRMPVVTWRDMPYMKAKVVHKEKTVKMKIPYEHSIELREKEVLSRTTFGDWEGDTVYSGRDDMSALLVLTERKTRMNINVKMEDRTQKSVSKALRLLETEAGVKTFREIFRSVTMDNGMEFRNVEELERTKYSDSCKRTRIFYAHPYSSFERGSNENQNKMIRRKIPKGDDIGLYSESDIGVITRWMNTYPRKMFQGQSSADKVKKEYIDGNISLRAYTFLSEYF